MKKLIIGGLAMVLFMPLFAQESDIERELSHLQSCSDGNVKVEMEDSISRIPILKECQGKSSEEDLQKCFKYHLNMDLSAFIDAFYLAKEDDPVRIIIGFQIEKNGKMQLNYVCPKEAPAVFRKNAYMAFSRLSNHYAEQGSESIEPALDVEGNPVNFAYQLPIVFSPQ